VNDQIEVMVNGSRYRVVHPDDFVLQNWYLYDNELAAVDRACEAMNRHLAEKGKEPTWTREQELRALLRQALSLLMESQLLEDQIKSRLLEDQLANATSEEPDVPDPLPDWLTASGEGGVL
jgi:hypothetical protein